MIKQTKNGWVDLSNLVYYNSKSTIDWSESIGKTVDFQYDEIVSTLTITGRTDNVQYVYIDIPQYVEHYKIYVGQIKHGQLGGAVKRITAEFKYNIGDIVDGLLIIGRYRKQTYKYYTYTCTIDGYNGEIREDHLVTGHGCPVCANKVVLVGYNDIATTNPDMAKLFVNINDTTKYTEHSNRYADFRCPRCGDKIRSVINWVAYGRLSCKKCGDGISYPNKFVYNFIEQLSALYNSRGEIFTFTPEKKFPWSMNFEHENKKLAGKKIYDIFIDTHNIIIENQGDYHYKHSFEHLGDVRSLKEVQINDNIKRDLALSHGIQEDAYITLDCSQSNMQYIKKSIMSSNLPLLLNFTEQDIDWQQCNQFATSSRVYEACCYWNKGIQDYKNIASLMKMHYSTIRRYIKKGYELNIIQN